jgi:hypothetical protein
MCTSWFPLRRRRGDVERERAAGELVVEVHAVLDQLRVRQVPGNQRGVRRVEGPGVRTGVTAVHHHGQVDTLGQLVEGGAQPVVEERGVPGHVVRAEDLVAHVVLVAVDVAHVRAMPRVVQHQHVTRLARGDQVGDRGLHGRLGGLLVEQGGDVRVGEAVQLGQHRFHVDHVVDASAQIRTRLGVLVDADQNRSLGHHFSRVVVGPRLLGSEVSDKKESAAAP